MYIEEISWNFRGGGVGVGVNNFKELDFKINNYTINDYTYPTLLKFLI